VTDDDGGQGSASLTIEVNNVAPTITANNVTLAEGETLALSDIASFSDPGFDNPAGSPPTQETFTFTVDWGDASAGDSGPATITTPGAAGTPTTGSFAANHVYADNNTYSAEACITDDDGAAACAPFQVTVTNALPTVQVGITQVTSEGSSVAITVSFNDLGTLDVHSTTINWGDGTTTEAGVVSESPFGPPGSDTGATGNVSGNHIYADNSTYPVEVCVTDDDGGVSCAAAVTIEVQNVAPTPMINMIGEGAEFLLVGVPVDLVGSFTDPGQPDTHTAVIDWGDGNLTTLGLVTSPLNSTHTYQVAGTYLVTLTVTDDDGGSTPISASIVVVEPAAATQETITDLQDLAQDPNLAPAAAAAINSALERLEGANGGQANNGALDHLQNGNWNAALQKIKQSLQDLEAAEVADPSLDLTAAKRLLAWTAQSVAVDIIAQAEAAANTPAEQQQVNQAKGLLAEGESLLAADDYLGAVTKFQDALQKAQGVL
jgi:PKD repeat protein